MKTRNGFVSNSSSSSFIIKRGFYQTVFSLANEMLDIRNDEWIEYSGNSDLGIEQEKLRQAANLGVGVNTAVWFSTTNYDTFIRLNESDQFEVDTCNNQNWSRLDTRLESFESYDESTGQAKRDREYYWHIRSGIFGKPISSRENPTWKATGSKGWPRCTKDDHFTGLVQLPIGKIVCIDCFELEKKPDMILSPRKIIKSIPSIILKPTIKMRGPV